MKFRKPLVNPPSRGELLDFYNSLPDEFEIVPNGHVCVKWPEGVTKDGLREVAEVLARDGYPNTSRVFREISAIAPERKKRRVSLWEAGGRIHVWGEHDTAGYPWRKVAGPIEIDD